LHSAEFGYWTHDRGLDREFVDQASKYVTTYGARIAANKTALLAYYGEHGKKVPSSDRSLKTAELRYLSRRDLQYDRLFTKQAKRLGISVPDALTRSERVARSKQRLLAYYKQYGRRVPKNHPLKPREGGYLCPSGRGYDPAFVSAARKLLKPRK
jgi:hypothetical protein